MQVVAIGSFVPEQDLEQLQDAKGILEEVEALIDELFQMRLQLLVDEHEQPDLLDQLLAVLIDGLRVRQSLDEVVEEGEELREVEDDAVPACDSFYEVVLVDEWRSDGDCMFYIDWLELSTDAELGLVVLHVLDLYVGLFGLERWVVVAVDGQEKPGLKVLDAYFFLILYEEGKVMREVVADDAPKTRNQAPSPPVLL